METWRARVHFMLSGLDLASALQSAVPPGFLAVPLGCQLLNLFPMQPPAEGASWWRSTELGALTEAGLTRSQLFLQCVL